MTRLDHWIEVEPERMERYEAMFQWREFHEALIAPAEIVQDRDRESSRRHRS